MRTKQIKVLIIEDSVAEAKLAEQLLTMQGKDEAVDYLIMHETSLTQAKKNLEKNSFDVILLDLNLPDSSGLDDIADCNFFDISCPVIVLTSLDDQNTAVQALTLGAQDYLVKGKFDGYSLSLSIRYAIERYKLMIMTKEKTYQATHDCLTGLPNRQLLYDRVEQVIYDCERTKTSCAIFFIDLDGFKNINDNFGHDYGDAVLKIIASRLNNLTRKTDTVARIGGDEFIIVLNRIKQHQDLSAIADAFIQKISEQIQVKESTQIISASIGIAIYPEHGNSVRMLLKRADAAMYTAKTLGKNNYKIFSSKDCYNAVHEHSFLSIKDFIGGIRNSEFFVCLQTQVDFASQEWIGVEALIRWQHPENGLLLPDKFIPLSEKMGFIHLLGNFVLNNLIKHYIDNPVYKRLGAHVSWNVSPSQLTNDDVVNMLASLLETHDIDPESIYVEITENVFIHQKDVIIKTLKKIKSLGIKLMLDDFGAGYSSLNCLADWPVDVIKIDKHLVGDCLNDKKKQSIINATIAMAKQLDIAIIAEGVESIEQADYLLKHGCTQMQGFFFSHPVAIDKFDNYLKNSANNLFYIDNKNTLK